MGIETQSQKEMNESTGLTRRELDAAGQEIDPERVALYKEMLESMGLVRGELDANGQEIDPERIALFKKMLELRREIESDYVKAMGAALPDDDGIEVTEAAKATANALFDKLKNRG